MNPIEKELTELLNLLDSVCEKHEEVGDSDVRDKLSEVVSNGFINPVEGFEIPSDFGMFSDEGNEAVKKVISEFIGKVVSKVGSEGLESSEKRLNAFQDEDIESSEGMFYDDYFGYAE